MLILADARRIPLVDGCVQCVVTSPPYWGLRDYGTARWEGGDAACDHLKVSPSTASIGKSTLGSNRDGVSGQKTNGHQQEGFKSYCGKCGARRVDAQIGLEPSPNAYVSTVVDVFRDVRRVLADDGVVWLNLGSSYFGGVPGAGGASPKQVTNAGSFFDGKRPTPSRQPARALACDSDGRALPDSMGAGSVYSDLCDGCLADFLSHRDRIAGSVQRTSQSEPPPWPTGRDTEPSDYGPTSQGALLHGVPVSTSLRSWLQRRGECLRCDSRASASDLLGLRSSSVDAPACDGMSWLNYTKTLKQKDMVPTPWMLAMSLQADGWYLRSDVIWSKPNPMPESVTDRPTKSHEYVFLLTKSERYFYDHEAIKNPPAASTLREIEQGYDGEATKDYDGAGVQNPSSVKARIIAGKRDKQRGHGRRHAGFNDRWDAMPKADQIALGSNARSVWTIATKPYAGAHFATMPEKLAERCILAGSRPGDLVLDPFGGSGTTVRVARRFNRRGVMLDLNQAYLQLAAERISGVQTDIFEVPA